MPEPDPLSAPSRGYDPVDAALAAAFGPDPSAAEVPGCDIDFGSGGRLRDADPDGADVPADPAVPDLRTIGRYEVVGAVARGGMGAVLRGRDPVLGRDLAVKVLLERHRANPLMVRRF